MELPDVDLEINPLKVYDKLINDITEKHGSCSLPKNVSAEEAANHQDVQALIGPRVKTLMGIGASFLSAIMSSVDEIPYGIRWICKQIRSLVKRKFQDSTEAQKCSLIGGFFMLRYINPAIVTPQAYMLIGKEPQAKTKRILTLVAKLLQNLANKPTVTKEQFMHVLNPFVEHNEARFQKFLNQICDVGDFYEALEVYRF
jgi:Ras GTPase-activating-like protein IQGAP2/3